MFHRAEDRPAFPAHIINKDGPARPDCLLGNRSFIRTAGARAGQVMSVINGRGNNLSTVEALDIGRSSGNELYTHLWIDNTKKS